jgi:succinate dehydrogenase/fumarate reductase flavoprotein subunit
MIDNHTQVVARGFVNQDLLRLVISESYARMLDLEIQSLIENAEMVLRGSLERKESRRAPFGFSRADYPDTNDADYFAFLSQRREGQSVRFAKIALRH